MTRLLVALCVMMMFTIPAKADKKNPATTLTGRYAGIAHDSGTGTFDLGLQITNHNGIITGTVSTEQGVSRISDGVYRAGQLTLSFVVEELAVDLTASVVGRQITGSYTSIANHGTFSLNLISSNPVFTPKSVKNLTTAQWREDVRFFAAELEKRHVNAFHHVTKVVYERLVDLLLNAIPHFKYSEIIVGMDKITAMVGDAHTYVHLPESFHRYPLSLYWFGSELRVLKTSATYKRALGARLAAINGVPILTVKKKIREIFSQDETDWLLLRSSPGLMMVPEILASLKIVPDVISVKFSFVDDSGRQFDMMVQPSSMNAEMSAGSKTVPTGFQSDIGPFSVQQIDGGKATYVSFTAYDNLAENCKGLFQTIDAKAPEKLIIDMRQNSGGDYLEGRKYLVDEIMKRPAVNHKGRLFILIGRSTFSAAMSNAADFRKDTNAILVGEPIGEKPNSYQERRLLTLPNSQTVISYSTKYYSFAADNTSAIVPDKRIDPSWKTFKLGRDPVMEWILANHGE